MIRKLFLAIFLILAFAVPGWTYTETHCVCIDGEGAGATNGTNWANCFDGFGDIAWDGETEDADDNEVGPNDKLELRDDDGFYREQLSVGASGLSGKPITIGIETGDSPVISGADLVAGWTETMGTPEQQGLTDLVADLQYGGTLWVRNIIPSGTFTADETAEVRVQIEASSTADSIVLGVSVGERDGASEDYNGAPTRITFDTGNHGVTVTAAGTKWSDWVSFIWDNADDHLIHIQYSVDGGNSESRREWSVNTSYRDLDPAGDETLDVNVTADSQEGYYGIELIEIRDVLGNVWQAALTTGPPQVFFDDTLGTEEPGGTGDLNGANEWYWNANVLYVYSTGDPDDDYTSPGIEATVRTKGLYLADVSYVTAEDLIIEKATANVYIFAWSTSPSNIVLDNLTLDDTPDTGGDYEGVSVRIAHKNSQTVDSVTIQNCTINASNTTRGENSGEIGIFVPKESTNETMSNLYILDNTFGPAGEDAMSLIDIVGGTISGNTAHGNSENSLDMKCPDAITIKQNYFYGDGECNIVIHEGDPGDCVRTNQNNIIEENRLVRGTGLEGSQLTKENIYMADGSGNTVRYNTLSDAYGSSIKLNVEVNVDIIGNVFWDWGTNAEGYAIELFGASTGGEIYSNTFYNSAYKTLEVSATATGTKFKNNLSYNDGASHITVDNGGETNFDSNYNLFYPDTGTKFNWLGNAYNFADWKTNSGHDAASPTPADPKMTNPGADDFTLQGTSPAIDVGVYLSGFDTALREDMIFGASSNSATMPNAGADGKADIGVYPYPKWGAGGL